MTTSGEVRWLVLPERPAGTEHLTAERARAADKPGRDGRRGEGRPGAKAGVEERHCPHDRATGHRRPGRAAALQRRAGVAEPWDSWAFGMAVSLYQACAFTWPEFQAALIARVHRGRRDRVGPGRTRTTTGSGWLPWKTRARRPGRGYRPARSPPAPRPWRDAPQATRPSRRSPPLTSQLTAARYGASA